jgi:hypothetical protein
VTQVDQLRLDHETSKAAAAGETVNQAALRSDLFQQFVGRVGEVAKLNLKGSTDCPALVESAAAENKSEFVTKVNSQADAAAKYEQLCIDSLPADFLAQIKTGVAQVLSSAGNRHLPGGSTQFLFIHFLIIEDTTMSISIDGIHTRSSCASLRRMSWRRLGAPRSCSLFDHLRQTRYGRRVWITSTPQAARRPVVYSIGVCDRPEYHSMASI